MGDLSKNLSRHEFACKCQCGFDTVDHELVEALQSIVDECERSSKEPCWIKVTSGNRCSVHNKNEGGAVNSQHLFGRAADFKVFTVNNNEQFSPTRIKQIIEFINPSASIGLYSNRNHIDTRSNGPKFWDAR